MTASKGLGRRVGWAVIDQGLSSATNFALLVVVANAVDQRSFGAFGVALAAFQLSLSFVRSMVGEPLSVRHSTVEVGVRRAGSQAATAAAALLGGVAGAVALVAAAVSGAASAALVMVALLLPALMVQDAYRYVCFVGQQPRRACAIDGVWTVLQAATLAVAVVLTADAAGYVVAWGVAGAGSAVFAARLTGIVPEPRRAWAWIVEHRDLGPRFALEALAIVGVGQIVFLAVSVLAGLEDGGAYRGGLALFGPLRVVLQGLAAVVVPHGVGLAEHGAKLRRVMMRASGANMAVAAAAGALYRFGPDFVGRALLGETWRDSRQLVVAFTVATIASGCTAGAVFGLRALAAARESLRAQLGVGTVTLAACTLAASMSGAMGAAWALAAAQCIGATVMWRVFVRAQAARDGG